MVARSGLKIYKRLKRSTKGKASCLNSIGYVYDSLGDFDKALEYYKRALKILEEIGDRRGGAISLNNIGSVYHNIGDYEQSLKYSSRALKILEEIGCRSGEALSFINMGNNYLETGKSEEAEEWFYKALSIANELGSKDISFRIISSITSFYLEKGDIDKAEDYLNKASQLANGLGSKSDKASTLCFSGRLATLKGKGGTAKKAFEESIVLFKGLKAKFELGKIYFYYGKALKEMREERREKGDYKRYLMKAKKIFEKLGAKGWMKKTQKLLVK